MRCELHALELGVCKVSKLVNANGVTELIGEILVVMVDEVD